MRWARRQTDLFTQIGRSRDVPGAAGHVCRSHNDPRLTLADAATDTGAPKLPMPSAARHRRMSWPPTRRVPVLWTLHVKSETLRMKTACLQTLITGIALSAIACAGGAVSASQ